MAKIEHMRLCFHSQEPDTAEKRQVEEMALKVAAEINEPVKELIAKFKEMQDEHLEDVDLGKWIVLQKMLPVSSLIIRTFKAVPVEKETYDTIMIMEKIWVAVEKSREEEENS